MIEQRRHRYFTEQEICDFFDMTTNNFRMKLRPHIPERAIDSRTKPPTYHGRTVIEIFAIHRKRTSLKIEGVASEIDSKLAARERLYEEQFRIAKMRRIEMQHNLISTKKVTESLGRLETILRELGERLKKSVGQKALDLLNESLSKYSREVADLWSRAWKTKTIK